MSKKILLLATLVFFSTSAIADNSYLCIADLVTGFHHDESHDTWEQSAFLPGERFVLNEERENFYRIERSGDTGSWAAICNSRTDLSEDSITCESGTNQFHFNRKLLRFTSFRYFGYWNGSSDSLSISIGKCFPT